ncbi:hypothetical protein HOL21_04370 [Candidatus Woesearchaeota archaeon]|jgi:hypothetical protein|nr:hypothetical protein [Candidatus Woesearchaeota archaeon]MBT5397422.1 hypothetical protein [Candidatus Woesearchaeota archaeon]MBT5924245.1 hypothetical protein [Candidatus Woesearchaeota archaeon]MBT6367056.1 hypothetical protein [Candidatus Woesearchaeota archaeon]MBT7762822.1 hypothetical protein [Candidatus Woesearchaeota archaeon]
MSINKKAQFDVARKSIYWMIAGFIITLVVIGFVLIIVNYRNALTEFPPEINAEFISLRFTNIPECFAYQDVDTKRVYPGVIDLDKFTTERMELLCYKTNPEKGHGTFNFELELRDKGTTIKTNNYFNAATFTLKRNVFVRDANGILSKDELLIHTQVKIPHFRNYEDT